MSASSASENVDTQGSDPKKWGPILEHAREGSTVISKEEREPPITAKQGIRFGQEGERANEETGELAGSASRYLRKARRDK